MMYFGMLAFGIGHVLYITSMAIRFPDYEMNLLWSALGSAAIVGVMFLVCVYAMKMQFGKFLIPEHSVCIFALLVRGAQRNVRQARTRFGIGRDIACRRDTFRALGYGAFDDVFFKTCRLRAQMYAQSRIASYDNRQSRDLLSCAIPHCAFAFVYLKNESDFRNLKSACALKRIPIF